jgi:hypothetical protein
MDDLRNLDVGFRACTILKPWGPRTLNFAFTILADWAARRA